MDEKLLPCPFCGAGNTEIRDNGKVWSGMGYSAPTSTSVFHHCKPVAGQPSRAIERVGRDRASAIAAWNQRAEVALPGVDEPFEDRISDWAHGDALDAARYRWLRDNATRSGVNIDIGAGVEISDTLDAAVDDAMRLTAAKESP